MKILLRPGETTTLQEGTMDPVILEYLKKQDHILPRPKDNSASDTQGLKDDRNKQPENSKKAPESDTPPLLPKLFAELARQKEYNKASLAARKWSDEVGVKTLRRKSEPVKKYYGKNINGEVKTVNGWDDVEDLTENQRIYIYNKHNPSGNAISEIPGPDQNGFKARRYNVGTPEEEAYWAKYLGLDQDLIKPTSVRKTDGSDNRLKNVEFVGTPRNMDLRTQAIADTTYTGRLSRLDPEQYKILQEQNPLLADQEHMQKTYKFGKTMLDNPGKIMQAGEYLSPVKQMSPAGTKLSGLGAFGGEKENKGGFGMMWNDRDNTVNSWDTYDYSRPERWLSSIPDRKTKLEIRSKVKLDPEKGSVLLRDLLHNTKK